MPEEIKYINQKDIASLLNISQSTVRYYIKTGKIHPIENSLKGRVMFHFSEVEPLIHKRIAIDWEEEYKRRRDSFFKAFGPAPRWNGYKAILDAFIKGLAEDYLSGRDYDLFMDILDGIDRKALSKKYDLTPERIRQLSIKVMLKMRQATRKEYSYKRELELAKSHIDYLTHCLNDANDLIRELLPSPKIINKPWSSKLIPKDKVGLQLSRPIEDFRTFFSTRTYNCLKVAGVKYLWQLLTKPRTETLKFRNFGKKSLNELDCFFDSLGIKWDKGEIEAHLYEDN